MQTTTEKPRRQIPTATSLDNLSNRKQWIIAHHQDVPRGDFQFTWVPTIEPDEYSAIVGRPGKPGMREAGLYGTAQRKMPEGAMIGGKRAFYELVCWRIMEGKK